MFADLLFRLRALFQRVTVESELQDELHFHLEKEQEKLRASGVSPEEARRCARLRFGGVEQIKEEVRSSWAVGLVETLAADLQYGWRSLLRNPGFSATAILSLALAIGAATAVFSVVNGVLLNALPYPESHRIAVVLESKASQSLDWLFVSNNNFLEWRRRSSVFESMVATTNCGYQKSLAAETQLLDGICASADFFPMLGVQPILGHLWNSENDVLGSDHVAVLSYNSWQSDFGGDPKVLGKTVTRVTDRQPFSIIGVLPRDFQFGSEDTKVWTPLAIDRSMPITRFHILLVFGRLKPGISYDQARAEMSRIAAQLETEFPQSNNGWKITVKEMKQFYESQGNTRDNLLILFGAVGGLLLIACANVANLLMARATVREKEIAVRSAIGATRGRLIRQLLTESLLLGVVAGMVGFAIGCASFKPMLSIAPRIAVFRPNALRIDTGVFAFSMLLSLLATALFGLIPAFRTAEQGIAGALTEAGRGGHGSLRTSLTRNALVITEIAVAVVLLTGTGLLIRTLNNLQRDRLGYETAHVVTMPICCLDTSRFAGQPQINAFYQQAFDAIRGVPGVQAASATSALPTRLFDGGGSQFSIRGFPPPGPGREYLADMRFVEPDYFNTMGIALLRGRLFTRADDGTREPSVLINDHLAHRYWPESDPIGQQVQFGFSSKPFTIIGVVANSRDRGLGRDTRNSVYFNDFQISTAASRSFDLLVRVRGESADVPKNVREAILSIASELHVGEVRTFDDVLSHSLSPQRFSTTLMIVFASLALGVALVGVYGVTSYSVAQRRKEIGVRMALGARPADVMLMVIREGTRLAIAVSRSASSVRSPHPGLSVVCSSGSTRAIH
jgi:Acidobacterial duplicated orphan permease